MKMYREEVRSWGCLGEMRETMETFRKNGIRMRMTAHSLRKASKPKQGWTIYEDEREVSLDLTFPAKYKTPSHVSNSSNLSPVLPFPLRKRKHGNGTFNGKKSRRIQYSSTPGKAFLNSQRRSS